VAGGGHTYDIGPGFVLVIIILGIIALGGLANAVFGDDKAEPTKNEQLCTLISSGASIDSLAFGHSWREWTDTYSPATRKRIIRSSANHKPASG